MLRLALFIPLFLLGGLLAAQEICDNGIDDDGDGLIDLQDDDCACMNVIAGQTSLIPNPSFEQTNCIPTTLSQLNCATSWQQATNPTTDYFHTAGYFPNWVPAPLPDGNGAVGTFARPNWQEYLGACLISPMLAGETYSINFHIAAAAVNNLLTATVPIYFGPVEITLFGRPNCVPFPVGGTGNGCPVPAGWTVIGTTTYTPSNDWTQLNITFTPPFDVATVILGSPCVLPPDYVSQGTYAPFLMYDNLLLGEDIPFSVDLDRTGEFCTENVLLTALVDTLTGNYQWYHDSIAVVGQTGLTLDVSGLGLPPGSYQFRNVVNDSICVIGHFDIDPPTPVQANFTVTTPGGCVPHTTGFVNTTTGGTLVSCTWDFGNGTSSNLCTPTGTFAQAGTYDVTLSVVTDLGCTADTTITAAVTVDPLPVASFTPDITEGCEDLLVSFTNTSVGTGLSCAWSFGDGSTGNTCDPAHLYTASGEYDVQLSVTSAQGCQHDTLMPQLITVWQMPVLQFAASALDGCRPLQVDFTNNTAPQDVGTCAWTFGQGATSSACDAGTLYAEAGTYSIGLTVTSPFGCTSDTLVQDMITVYDLPVPSLLATPEVGCRPLFVQFQNTTDPGQSAQCQWTFGDGGSSTDCTPGHVYLAAGQYDVGLTIISFQGCVGDTLLPDHITVHELPVADFLYSPNSTDVHWPYYAFTDASTSDVVAWHWWVGETGLLGSATVPDPVFTFPNDGPGDYPVFLEVTNHNGCVDTVMRVVTIDGWFSLFVPNAFTPDGDGVNDVFMPSIRDHIPARYRLSIFDRWGRLQFETLDLAFGWDGTLGGSPAKQDVYIWQLEASSLVDGITVKRTGHVTLLR